MALPRTYSLALHPAGPCWTNTVGQGAPGSLHGQICVHVRGLAGTRGNEHIAKREERKQLINNIFDVYCIYDTVIAALVCYGVRFFNV